MLGYFLETTTGFSAFLERLGKVRTGRHDRALLMVQKLNSLGMSITLEDVLKVGKK